MKPNSIKCEMGSSADVLDSLPLLRWKSRKKPLFADTDTGAADVLVAEDYHTSIVIMVLLSLIINL